MKKRNSILAFFLAMSLAVVGPVEVLAEEITPLEQQEESLPEQQEIESMDLEWDEDMPDPVDEMQEEQKEELEEETLEDLDPGQWRLSGEIPEGFGETDLQTMATSSVVHNPKFNGLTIQKGIDVSKWNETIDWAKVKNAGIQFAIVRTSYRTYSRDSQYSGVKGLNTDPYYKTNITNALKNGIPVGVYIFSQATSIAEAQQEANYVLQTIKGYDISLPVVFDYEYAGGSSGKLQYWKNHSKPSKATMTNICMAFCKVVSDAGYMPMVYANKSMLTNDLNAATISASYPVWLAHYTNSTDYAGDYEYWQYSEKGKVSGCTGNSGYVDVNFRYMTGRYNNCALTASPVSTSSIALKWKAVPGADGYTVERLQTNGEYLVLKDTTANTYTDTKLSSGAAYTYRVRPYKMVSVEQDSSITESEVGGTTKKDYDSFVFQAKVQAATKLPAMTMEGGSGKSFDSVSVNWKALSDVSGYQIQRYDSAKKAYVTVKTVGGAQNTSTVISGDMNANTTYKFRIRAYKNVSNTTAYSDYTSDISVKTGGNGSGKTTAKNLALRKSASTSSKKLGTVKKKKTKVTILGSCGSWYKVKVKASGKNKTGFLKKSKVSLGSASSSSSSVKKTNQSSLVVRKTTSTTAAKVTTIAKKGTVVSVLGTVGSWLKISVKISGKTYTGYVLKKRIS